MNKNMARFVPDDEGQGMVEYGLILGLIAIVVIAALTATGTSVSGLFSYISGQVTT